MTIKEILAKPWARVAVFFWGIVFPIVFVAVPVLEMVSDKRPVSSDPAWAFGMWILGPWAVSIGLKYWGAGKGRTSQEGEN